MNSPMKHWLSMRGISYRQLASSLHQSAASVSLKVNGKTAWQQSDLLDLNRLYGLPADFVLGITSSKDPTFEGVA